MESQKRLCRHCTNIGEVLFCQEHGQSLADMPGGVPKKLDDCIMTGQANESCEIIAPPPTQFKSEANPQINAQTGS